MHFRAPIQEKIKAKVFKTSTKFLGLLQRWTRLQFKLLDPLSLSPGVLRCCWCVGAWSIVLLGGLLDFWRRPLLGQVPCVGRRCPQRRRLPGRVTLALKKKLVERGTLRTKLGIVTLLAI